MKRALLVGCGSMGQAWLDCVLKNARVQLAGTVDIRIEAARAAAAKAGLPERLAFSRLLPAIKAVRPDFLIDVTVPEAHRPTTVTALKHGVPVLGEKPMAESMAAARTMVKAAGQSGVLYMVSQSRRYDPNHVACRRAIEEGLVGDVTSVNGDFFLAAHFGGFRDRMPSPLILDMAIHHFDLCRLLTGADPLAVYAKEYNPKGSWYEGDAAASCIFEMTGGIVFTYRGSWCAEGCRTSWNGSWRITGTRGTLLMEADQPPRGERLKDSAQAGVFQCEVVPFQVPPAALVGTGIHGSLNEFLDAIENGAAPQGECRDNIKSLAMVFAAVESSKKGKRVPVRL